MIRGAPVGKRFSSACLDTTKVTRLNREAFEACMRVASGESRGVLLWGAVGVGKTHLLAGLAKAFESAHVPRPPKVDDGTLVRVPPVRELIEQAAKTNDGPTAAPTLEPYEYTPEAVVEYWPMLDLASELRAEAVHGELALSHRCRTCDLLILDDLGREKLTEFILQEFHRIVDWRYREMLPIALGTNGDFKSIITRYGEHTSSRWKESCEIVKVEGHDHRVAGN